MIFSRLFIYTGLSIIIIQLIFSQFAFSQEKAIRPFGTQNKYALIIGISKYKDPVFDTLRYPRNDVLALGKTIIENLDFPIDRVTVLLDQQATKNNIRNELSRLAEYSHPKDIVLIYFSGHGTYGEDKGKEKDEKDGTDEYLVPYDAEYGKIYTCIVDDIFGYLIKNINSNNIIVFLDSCYSGGAGKGVKAIKAKNLPYRAVSKDSVVSDISREGVTIITSAKSDQVAIESDKLSHGVFTYYLVDALKGSSDYNNDGKLSHREIYSFTYDKVKNWTYANKFPIQEPAIAIKKNTSFHIAYNRNPKRHVRWVNKGKKGVLIKIGETKRILVREGYYEKKVIKKPGKFVTKYKDAVTTRKEWVPGKKEIKQVWVPPEYKETHMPDEYSEEFTGGRFEYVD